MPDRARLDALAQWLQQEDDEILYAPDGSDTGAPPGLGCYVLEGRTHRRQVKL